jgi:hypothetical protein
MKNRVFVSATANRWLDDRRRRLKAAMLAKVREAGYEPQEFWESGIPENLSWSFENVDRVMLKCVGAVVFGFPRWTISGPLNGARLETRLVGEYNHYEGAVALEHGLPVLLLKEQGVENRGIVWDGPGVSTRGCGSLGRGRMCFSDTAAKVPALPRRFSFGLRDSALPSITGRWTSNSETRFSMGSRMLGRFVPVECFCSARTIPSKAYPAEPLHETTSCLRRVTS